MDKIECTHNIPGDGKEGDGLIDQNSTANCKECDGPTNYKSAANGKKGDGPTNQKSTAIETARSHEFSATKGGADYGSNLKPTCSDLTGTTRHW